VPGPFPFRLEVQSGGGRQLPILSNLNKSRRRKRPCWVCLSI